MKYYRLAPAKYANTVPAFNSEGLKMINHLHGLDNVFICEDDENFETALDLMKKDVSTQNFDLLLVRKFFDGHVQPIKIERRDSQDNVIVMDSQGKPYDNLYFTSSLIKLQRHLKTNIHYASTEIQKDNHSCYTFTAKVLSKMFHTPNLTQELENYVVDSTQANAIKVVECKYPERFAILAQSNAQLKEYVNDKGFNNGEIFMSKDGEAQTFEEKVYQPRISGGVQTPYVNGETLIPSLLDYFARKYAEKIDSMAETLDPENISMILNSQDSENLTEENLQMIGLKYDHDHLVLHSFTPITSSRMMANRAAVKD